MRARAPRRCSAVREPRCPRLRHHEAVAVLVERTAGPLKSSLNVLSAPIFSNPAIAMGTMAASEPPAIIMSAWPRRMVSAASPSAAARRTGGRNGEVRAAGAGADAHVGRRAVEHQRRDGEGAGAAALVPAGRPGFRGWSGCRRCRSRRARRHGGHPASACRHRHRAGLGSRDGRKVQEAIHASGGLPVEMRAGVEILDLSREVGLEVAGIERGQRPMPERPARMPSQVDGVSWPRGVTRPMPVATMR